MIQKNVIIPFNYNIAVNIIRNDIPGRILTAAGFPARIIDSTYGINKMLVMLMTESGAEHHRIFNHDGIAEDGHCTLEIQVPEWKKCHNGEVVFCEYVTPTASSQWIAILDGEIQSFNNVQTQFWSYADVVIYSTHEPTRIKVGRHNFRTQMVINKADASQRRLMAEHLVNNGSPDALKLVRKFIPEFANLIDDKKDE